MPNSLLNIMKRFLFDHNQFLGLGCLAGYHPEIINSRRKVAEVDGKLMIADRFIF